MQSVQQAVGLEVRAAGLAGSEVVKLERVAARLSEHKGHQFSTLKEQVTVLMRKLHWLRSWQDRGILQTDLEVIVSGLSESTPLVPCSSSTDPGLRSCSDRVDANGNKTHGLCTRPGFGKGPRRTRRRGH